MAPTLKKRAYQAICGKMIRGELSPGSRLSDFVIAKELGISRSPVREAISQLASEGLVTAVPEVGFFTRKFTKEDIQHLFQFRCWLELKVVEEAAKNITPEQLEQLGAYCDDIMAVAREHRDSGEQYLGMPGYWKWIKADFSFHSAIARAAGNPLVLKTIASQYFLSNCLNGYLWKHTLADLVFLYRQHREMLRALRHGHVDALQQMIIQHAERGQRHAIALLERQESRDNPLGIEGEDAWLSALHSLIEGIVEDHAS